MADLTQDNIQDIGGIVATQIQTIMPDMVRATIQDTVPGIIHEIIQEVVPGIVRQETKDIRSQLGRLDQLDQLDQLGQLGQLVGQQGMLIKTTQSEVRQLKELTRQQGILLEDLDERFRADSELLRSSLNVKDKVATHESRLSRVETEQVLLKRVVREHSRQLKTKSA